MSKFFKTLSVFLIIVFIGAGCSWKQTLQMQPTAEQRAQRVVDSLNREQKIDKLMMVPADYALAHTEQSFGGVFWPGWQIRGKSFEQIRSANLLLRQATTTPLIALDQEGGLVDRLQLISDIEEHVDQDVKDFIVKYFAKVPGDGRNAFEFPGQEQIGRFYNSLADEEKRQFLDDYQNLYALGLAKTLDEAGFNVNFAPVADLLPDDNTLTQLNREGRTFGANATATAELLSAYVEGFASYTSASGTRVLATAKHFPGIGSAVGDTHNTGVKVEKTKAELMEEDVAVYSDIIDKVPIIMLSQATYPAVDAENPAASSVKIRDLLVSELNYKGIIISDDITMASLDNLDNTALACDMILTVEDSMIPTGKSINERGSGQSVNIIDLIRSSLEKLSDEEIDERVKKLVLNLDSLQRRAGAG